MSHLRLRGLCGFPLHGAHAHFETDITESKSNSSPSNLYKDPIFWTDRNPNYFAFLLDVRRVVQKYVHNPYLFENRKVDLRFTYILTSVSPLRLYTLPGNIWLRPIQANYSSSLESVADLCIHANDFLNRNCYSRNPKEMRGGRRDEIFKAFRQDGLNIDRILSDADHATVTSFFSAEPKLRREFERRVGSRYSSYQYITSEFTLDEDGRLWLMEINSFPIIPLLKNDPDVLLLHGDTYSEILNVVGYHFPGNMSERAEELIRASMVPFVKGRHIALNPDLYRVRLGNSKYQSFLYRNVHSYRCGLPFSWNNVGEG
jgi:hypothetical protein